LINNNTKTIKTYSSNIRNVKNNFYNKKLSLYLNYNNKIDFISKKKQKSQNTENLLEFQNRKIKNSLKKNHNQVLNNTLLIKTANISFLKISKKKK